MTYNSWAQTATVAVGTPTAGGSPAGGTWFYKYRRLRDDRRVVRGQVRAVVLRE